MKISTVISYCSLDRRFIQPLLEQVKIFSDNIIVVYFDHLLDGTSEPIEEFEQLKAAAPDQIQTLCLPYTGGHPPRYFHNLARWAATEKTLHDHILYLDADEIPEGETFKIIAEHNLLLPYDGVDFRCNWYFRSAVNQAIETEQCGLLIKKDLVKKEYMFTEHERWIYRHIPNLKYVPLLALGTEPLLHHFSWVRTKEEMLTKVVAWGHKNDKNWIDLINEEFSRDFNGTDFVHGYRYHRVQDRFNIGL